jgi:hypothetical protein
MPAQLTVLEYTQCSEHAIMDFKQSNKPKKVEWIEDYKLQLCAYAEAHNEVYGTNYSLRVWCLMCCQARNR